MRPLDAPPEVPERTLPEAGGDLQAARAGPVDARGLPLDALTRHLADVGVAPVHAKTVFRAIHRERRSLQDLHEIGRHATAVRVAVHVPPTDVDAEHPAADGTTRLIVRLGDGARVETVLVDMGGGRVTQCVSTQVGCAMGCAFCATGTLGLTRDLTAGEVVGQVHAATARLGRRPDRLVFMGMGEPLHAYATTADALRVLLDGHGLGFASKAIVVSTVGLPARMRRFSEDFGGRVGLALSLHAGTDTTRQRIIPAARSAPLAALRAALLDHPLPGSRALMLEYVVLPGVNDGDDDLDGVAAFARGLTAIVNLLTFNPFPGAAFRSPTADEVNRVRDGLKARGVAVSVRRSRGGEASGACGQLMLAEGAQVPAHGA